MLHLQFTGMRSLEASITAFGIGLEFYGSFQLTYDRSDPNGRTSADFVDFAPTNELREGLIHIPNANVHA